MGNPAFDRNIKKSYFTYANIKVVIRELSTTKQFMSDILYYLASRKLQFTKPSTWKESRRSINLATMQLCIMFGQGKEGWRTYCICDRSTMIVGIQIQSSRSMICGRMPQKTSVSMTYSRRRLLAPKMDINLSLHRKGQCTAQGRK